MKLKDLILSLEKLPQTDDKVWGFGDPRCYTKNKNELAFVSKISTVPEMLFTAKMCVGYSITAWHNGGWNNFEMNENTEVHLYRHKSGINTEETTMEAYFESFHDSNALDRV